MGEKNMFESGPDYTQMSGECTLDEGEDVIWCHGESCYCVLSIRQAGSQSVKHTTPFLGEHECQGLIVKSVEHTIPF